MERVMKYPKRSWYLNLANYYEEQERGTIPFTPAVQVYYAFREALDELGLRIASNDSKDMLRRFEHACKQWALKRSCLLKYKGIP
jgi:aspartate aminotransferase-like enzyme